MKIKWPLMWKKTHEKILYQSAQMCEDRENHYWKQSAHNGMWERRAKKAEAELQKLKEEQA